MNMHFDLLRFSAATLGIKIHRNYHGININLADLITSYKYITNPFFVVVFYNNSEYISGMRIVF